MFIDIDYTKKPKKVKLHVAKPNKQIISPVFEYIDGSVEIELGGINELNFSIPYHINENGNKLKNINVEIIRGKMLIKLTIDDYVEWFIVNEIQEDSDDEDIFNVKCFSLPNELSAKRTSGIEEESINATELYEKILETTNWKLGFVDSKFNQMYRSFESGDDSNALNSSIDASETFGALLDWDTNNRILNLIDLDNVGQFKGMTVDYGRFLKTLSRTSETEEMTTRLWVYGSEELSIGESNPTGQNYIENFDYFKYPFESDVDGNVLRSSYFMSDELCLAIEEHERHIESVSDALKSYFDDLNIKIPLLVTEESELSTLNLELNTILNLLDVAKSLENEDLINQRTAERNAKESEIASKELDVGVLRSEVNTINYNISVIQKSIALENSFTEELLEELNYYIIESEWRDDRYIDSDELYNDGLKHFAKIREPKVSIEVSIDSLFNIIEEQYYWDKLNLGDLMKVRYDQMNIEYMARIVKIEYDIRNLEAVVTVANNDIFKDEISELQQILSNSKSASTMVQNSKYKWDKVNILQDEILGIITGEWDANKNKITAGINNTIEVGSRGIIIKNPDFPNEVVIMQSGIIALSKDGGETWKTAIKPDGIVAERLIGQILIGQNLLMTNSSGSFTFDNNGVRINASSFVVESSNQTNLVDKWNNSTDFVDQFRDDNVITPYEKKMIRTEWDKIISQYNANIYLIEQNYENSGADLEFVNNYKNSYTELYEYLFVENHGDMPMLDPLNMGNSTMIESSIFNSKFRNMSDTEIEVEKQLAMKANETANTAKDIAENAQNNIDEVMDDIVYKIEIWSSKGFIFKNGQINTELIARVYRGKDEITDTLIPSSFIWKKFDKDGIEDISWNNSHIDIGNKVIIDSYDIYQRATFSCDIEII